MFDIKKNYNWQFLESLIYKFEIYISAWGKLVSLRSLQLRKEKMRDFLYTLYMYIYGECSEYIGDISVRESWKFFQSFEYGWISPGSARLSRLVSGIVMQDRRYKGVRSDYSNNSVLTRILSIATRVDFFFFKLLNEFSIPRSRRTVFLMMNETTGDTSCRHFSTFPSSWTYSIA